jgi:hypothetical protein
VSKLQQQCQRFIRDPVLGIVEIESGGLYREPVATLAIISKKLAQMDVF